MQVVEVAEDGAEVFAGGDGAPSADGVEADGDCALGQQRRGFIADDRVGMVDAENEEGDAVGGGLAVFAGAVGGGELVGADDVLGAEVARAEAVAAAVDLGNLGERDGGQAFDGLERPWRSAVRMSRPRGLSPARASSVRSRMMTFFLPLSAAMMAASGKGRITLTWMEPTLGAAGLAQVIDGGLDVFSRGAERDEDRLGIFGLVLGDEAVVAAGQLGKVFVGGFEELQDGLGEVVAPRNHAVHVVFLILHRAEEDGIGQVHHLGNAAAGGSKEGALRRGGAVDDVVGRAEILADQLRTHACRRCARGGW